MKRNGFAALAAAGLILTSAWTALADYQSAVLSKSPLGYWPLNDTEDPASGTAVAVDSSPNSFNGRYGVDLQNGFNGIEGPRPPTFPGFASGNFGMLGSRGPTDSYVHLPQRLPPTNRVTFTMWIKPTEDQTAWAGLLCARPTGAGTMPGGVDLNSLNSTYTLGYIWNNDSSWSFNSGLVPPTNQWSFVAVAIEPTKATLYLYYIDATTGAASYLSAVNPTEHIVQNLGTNDWRLGCDFNGSRNFNGSIDAPAIFAHTLSSSEITALFVAGVSDYANTVKSLGPLGYWRLNDTEDPASGTAVAIDSSTNGLNGTYGVDLQNGFNGIEGPQPPTFPGFATNNFGILGSRGPTDSYVHLPQRLHPTNTVTFALWIKPTEDQTAWAGLLCARPSGAGTMPAGVDLNSLNSTYTLGYIWNNDSSWSFNSGLVPPTNQWSFVAVAIEPTKATLYLNYVDATTGVTNYMSAVNPTEHIVQNLGTNDWRLGCDFNGSRNFNGSIDEAAIFARTLSSSEITAIFAAGLGMNAVAPSVSQAPASKIVYAGRTVHFTAGASGSPAPTYQWQVRPTGSTEFTNLVNGGNVAGATSTTLALSNVAMSQAGDYRVVASNSGGSTASTTAALTVLAVTGLGSYPDAVYTNGPAAYWRLGESYSQKSAVDFAGDLMGTYQAGALWGPDAPGAAVSGPTSSTFPGFEANNTAVNTTGDGTTPSWVFVPSPALTANAATYIAWINPSVEPEPNFAGIFMVDANYQEPGLCFTTDGQLGYAWNNSGTLGFQSGLVPPANQWSMVALVVEPTMATLYLGTGGSLTSVINPVPHIKEIAWGLQAAIGVDRADPARAFQGVIDEVAMFDKALSFDQINSLYGVALGNIKQVAPEFVQQPASTTRYTGLTATFKSMVTGSTPTYQWFKGNQALADGGKISGAQTATLTLTSVAVADAGEYKLVATNPAGSATSAAATLNVLTPATDYEKAVVSDAPIAYWRLNEMTDPSSGTAVSLDYVGGFDGTYGAASQDGFNGIAGPLPADGFAIFETSNTALRSTAATAQSWVTAPQPVLNANTVTFTMWIYPDGDQADWTGLLMNRSGIGEGVDLGGGVSHNMLGYIWNDNTTWNFTSGLTVPQNQWSFVAVTIEPSRAILYLANADGMKTATNAIPHNAGTWGGRASIGCDGGNVASAFNGVIDEVAIFNYTLSPQQVQNLYAGISTVTPPTLTITTAADGKLVISWQGTGTLQSTPALKGSGTVWTDVGTTNPATVTPTGIGQFYRVRVP